MYRSWSVVIVMLPIVGCSGAESQGPAHGAPATVDHPRTEAEISTIRLTPEAVKRLGVQTVAVKTDVAAATRTLGGEVVVPEGRGVVVTAPVAGTLGGAPGLRAGARVRRGDRLMTIAPLVSAERDQRIEAQRAVTSAEAEEVAARQRVQRLEQLLKDGAASLRSVEEARAQHQVSLAALTAARERLAAASRNPVGAQGELAVSAPFDGVVQSISAVPGQIVAASAPLLEIAQVDTLWIRVPVYAGDADAIDREAAGVCHEAWCNRLPEARTSRDRAAPGRSASRVREPVLFAARSWSDAPAWRTSARRASVENHGERTRRAGGGRAVRHARRHVGVRRPWRQRLHPAPHRDRAPCRRPGGRPPWHRRGGKSGHCGRRGALWHRIRGGTLTACAGSLPSHSATGS